MKGTTTMTTSTVTIGEQLAKHSVSVPKHLEAAMSVPVSQAWQQGDIYYMPCDTPCDLKAEAIPNSGIKVVTGDADRNSHILDCDHPDARWYPGTVTDPVADYGLFVVPDGALAYLTHTDEHGTVAIPAGRYRIWGQVSYEDTLRRAAD